MDSAGGVQELSLTNSSASKLFSSSDSGKAQGQRGLTTAAFFSSILFSFGVFVVQVGAFCVLRKQVRRIYEPRCFMVPKTLRVGSPGDGFWQWIEPLYRVSLDEVREKSGLDAYFFLRYILVAIYICAMSACVALPILLPVNVTGSSKTMPSGALGLDCLSWVNISGEHTVRYTVQFLLAIVFVVFLCFVFHYELAHYVEIRRGRLQSEPHHQRAPAATILIKPLPIEFQNANKVRDLFSKFPGGVNKVWMNRDVHALAGLVQARKQVLAQLETAETQVVRKCLKMSRSKDEKNTDKNGALVGNSWRGFIRETQMPKHWAPLVVCGWGDWRLTLPLISQRVDTISWCKGELSRLNRLIEQSQQEGAEFKCSNSCFVQFNSQFAAHLACQCNIFGEPRLLAESMCEIDPRSIIWANLGTIQWVEIVKRLAVSAVTGVMVVGWAAPVAYLALLSQIEYLAQLVPLISPLVYLPATVKSLASIVLSPWLLGVLMSLAPVLFRKLARARSLTHVHAELSVQKYLFAFLFIQVFLVVTLTNGLVEIVFLFLDSPVIVPGLLARDLPKSANFFFMLLVVEGMTTSGNTLVQLNKLFGCGWSKLTTTQPGETAREQFTRLTDFPSWDWGSTFPPYTNLLVIVIIYAVVAPLVLVFGFVAFGMFYMAFKYKVMFCNVTKFESNGLFYPRAIFQLFTGVYCMEICLIGLLVLARDGGNQPVCYPHALLMTAGFVATAVYHYYLYTEFRPLLKHIPVVEYDKQQDTKETLQLTIQPLQSEDSTAAANAEPHGHIFDNLEMDFDRLTGPQREHIVEMAYTHPALRAGRPCVWVPWDPLGIAADQLQEIRQLFPHINASCADSVIDEHGKISITRAPPDYNPAERMEL